jgi:hypothetical protein
MISFLSGRIVNSAEKIIKFHAFRRKIYTRSCRAVNVRFWDAGARIQTSVAGEDRMGDAAMSRQQGDLTDSLTLVVLAR